MDEIIEDDGSHSLTIGALTDVEIRLTLANALAKNETVSKWSGVEQLGLADMWFKYVKTGEVPE